MAKIIDWFWDHESIKIVYAPSEPYRNPSRCETCDFDLWEAEVADAE